MENKVIIMVWFWLIWSNLLCESYLAKETDLIRRYQEQETNEHKNTQELMVLIVSGENTSSS